MGRERMLEKFVGRTDVHLEQTKNGYVLVRKPITIELLKQHLNGLKTIATFVITENGKVKYGVVDLDGTNFQQLRNTAELIFNNFPEFQRCLEFSGRRGFHVWIFFDTPERPLFVKNLIKTRLRQLNIYDVEVFPKQDYEPGKLGNAIKLPCGKHKNGMWSRIIKWK
jgi:hypothetical protein